MKTSFLAAFVSIGWIFGSLGQEEKDFAKPSYPLPEWVGDWSDIQEQLLSWEISEFEYRGGIADGGSK
ncbi:MAG: hypothetical protein AAF236_07535, partial [Verrucomicrobiota bacterium]